MNPRPDVSEERKDQILQAAMAVFARHGFKKARMDDIVAESGLSKGTLYWYFDSKDDIILALVEEFLQRELSVIRSVSDQGGSAKRRLLDLVDHMIMDIKVVLDFMPVYYELYALATRSTAIHQLFRDYFRSYMEVLIPIFQQGINQGEFRSVSAENAAIALGSLIEGTILLMAYDPETIRLEEHIRSSVDYLFQGLEPKRE